MCPGKQPIAAPVAPSAADAHGRRLLHATPELTSRRHGFVASRPDRKRRDALPDQPDTLPAPRTNSEGWQRVAGVSFQGRRGERPPFRRRCSGRIPEGCQNFPPSRLRCSTLSEVTRVTPATYSTHVTHLTLLVAALPRCVHLWFLQPQSRRCPEPHLRGQRLQSEARNAKTAPESTICGALPNRPAPTSSVPWLVPISSPRSAPRRVGQTNLRSDALRLWRSPPPCRSPPPHSSRKRPWCSE